MNKFLIIAVGLIAVSCSSKNIHPELTENKKVLVRQWTFNTGKEFIPGNRGIEHSNAALFENTLVFGNESIGLVAMYPKLKLVRWVLPIPNGISSEIEIANRTVFFGGGDGFVYAVDIDTGIVKWRYEVRTPWISKPEFAQGRLFFTAATDQLYSLDAGSGEWIWSYKGRSNAKATIMGSSSPIVADNRVIVGMSNGYAVAVSLNEGKLVWQERLHTGAKFSDVDAKPILSGGRLYLPSYDGALYALDPKNGKVIWKFDAGGATEVSITGNTLILPSSDGKIYALAADTGKKLWDFRLDGGVPTQVSVTDKLLIFGSSHQYLYALDKESGKPLFRFNAGYEQGFYGPPVFSESNNSVFILSSAGNMYQFRVREMRRRELKHGMMDPYEFSPEKSFY